MASSRLRYRTLAAVAVLLISITIWTCFAALTNDAAISIPDRPSTGDAEIAPGHVAVPLPFALEDPTPDNSIPSHARLLPRAPSVKYQTCVGKGCKLKDLLDADTLPTSDETKYTEYSQLGTYGWMQQMAFKTNTPLQPAMKALEALGIPTNSQDNSWDKVDWRHKVETTVDGVTYPPTGAYYTNFYNVPHGLIVATDNNGPAHMYKAPKEPNLVPLRQLSDVLWLTWADLAGTNKQQEQGLKYVIRASVANQQTRDVIGQAMPSGDLNDLPEWPGKEFDLSSENGLALLGRRMGTVTVAKITVWDAGDVEYRKKGKGPDACMLFEITGP
ncbi:hypothetical protein LTR85_008614 [Meristemomyces frigidus]|nr:hypothetical protein LTR85_008614 [Meristemomyces frigidus]